MKFTLSTKPLKTVTELGIIKANVSPFFRRSSLVQLTANRDTLKINIQAASIKTRMELKGSGDEDKEAAICVDCLIFKNLINSIDNDVIALEFVDNGLYIHAGNSKFAIPQMSDVSEAMLEEPVSQYNAKSSVVIQPADWQFVKDHQMFAIAVKEEHPVYRNVWVGPNKEVLVGDFDISLFTFSKKGNFLNSCLLTPSLINLFTAIPEGATVSMIDRNYVLSIETDSYSMVTEFLPKYEDDESVGSYNSQVFLNMMKHPESFITVDITPITKFIQQTAILGVQGMDVSNWIDSEKAKGNDPDLDVVEGVYVDKVSDASAAEEAGLEKGDVVTEFDGKKVTKMSELQEAIAQHRPGDKVNITYKRGKKEHKVNVTLRNTQGTTKVMEEVDLDQMGVALKPISEEEQKSLSIDYGLTITAIRNGKMKTAGAAKGTIILQVNDQKMKTVEDWEEAVKSANQSTDRTLWIKAITPSGRKVSYVIELDE